MVNENNEPIFMSGSASLSHFDLDMGIHKDKVKCSKCGLNYYYELPKCPFCGHFQGQRLSVVL